jgi:hypothetical protein
MSDAIILGLPVPLAKRFREQFENLFTWLWFAGLRCSGLSNEFHLLHLFLYTKIFNKYFLKIFELIGTRYPIICS